MRPPTPNARLPINFKRRILLIEDDSGRIDIFKRWLEGKDFLLVITESAGKAMGMLSKNGVETIAGVLLDHDLSDASFIESDLSLSATNVLPLIIQRVKKSVPILIHSMNLSKPREMERKLTTAGFSVSRIPFRDLTKEQFDEWLLEVDDNWDP